MRKGVLVAVGALLLAGCGSGSEMTTGAIPGANPGIVTNSPVGAGAGEAQVGVVEGGLMGTDVGKSLTEADRAIALKAEYEALEYGRSGNPGTWQGTSNDSRGQIYVGGTYQVNRLDCRSYTHNVTIGGRLRVVSGTACREPDGIWRIVG